MFSHYSEKSEARDNMYMLEEAQDAIKEYEAMRAKAYKNDDIYNEVFEKVEFCVPEWYELESMTFEELRDVKDEAYEAIDLINDIIAAFVS